MMKNRSFYISLLTFLGGISLNWHKPIHSASTIIQCSGQIPNRTSCLINPSSFKLEIYRIDICQDIPFPDYRSTPNYSGSGCISLFNSNGKLYKFDIKNGPNYKIPNKGRDNIKPGSYKYLAMIFKNSFKSSGVYTTGEKKWMTAGLDKRNKRNILKLNEGEPIEFTTKLTNWRGINNKDNDYCHNKGGTFSRCEIKYNGYEITAIGLGSDLIENHGSQLSYIFYMNKLLSPINLNQSLDGDFYLKDNNKLEVYGNGKTIRSISIAPLIFEATYNK